MSAVDAAGSIALSVHDDVPEREGAIVDAGLGAENDAAAPLHEVRRLSCFARLGDAVIGGAIGRTWGECCELQQLWVAPAHRRRNVASRLVRAFEARAQVRGCRRFYLETFSFQAPELYRRLGYRVGHELRGFPGGIVKYVMTRDDG
jgi:ribosomal protein S18 acetylase RimI-like enzyme